MHDALRVRLAGGVAELQRDVERPRQRHRPARPRRARSGATARPGTPSRCTSPRRAAARSSSTCTTLGCARREATLASRWKRATSVGLADSSRWRIFTATSRSMPFWNARYTAPHRADADELADLDVPEDLAPQVRVGGGGGGDGARGRGERARRRASRTGRRPGSACRTTGTPWASQPRRRGSRQSCYPRAPLARTSRAAVTRRPRPGPRSRATWAPLAHAPGGSPLDRPWPCAGGRVQRLGPPAGGAPVASRAPVCLR